MSAPGEALWPHQLLPRHQPRGLLRQTGHPADHRIGEHVAVDRKGLTVFGFFWLGLCLKPT